MEKEKRIISYFLGWLLIGFLICFIGINNVFAEEVAYSNATFRVKECGSNEWSNWTSATQKLSVYSINNLGFRLYFNNTQLTGNTYYNITVTYNFYTEAPSINVMNSYGKTTFYYNTTASENGNIQGNNNNYSVRFEKDTENTNLIKAVYNVLVPVNSKFIAFNINWQNPNNDTCRTLSDGFTISNIKVDSLNDTQAIVDGNNANTDNIINNNNQNTNNIINNQNQNTQDIINSNKVCNTIDKKDIKENGKFLSSSGILTNYADSGVTDYININGAEVTTLTNVSAGTGINLCYYNVNKDLISCVNSSTNINELLNIPNNAYYMRASILNTYNRPSYKICKNGNQATNDNLNDLNDSLNDSNIDSSLNGAGNFFDSFQSTDHGGLSGIITAPLVAINEMLNTSCNPMTTTFKGKELSLPCGYEFWNRLGAIQDFLNVVLGGMLCYNIVKKLFKLIERIKNPEDDRVEVMDL